MTTEAIRVLTWNIHGGFGLDGRYDMNRVMAFTRAINPDIAALQEVDGRALGDRPQAPLSLLKEGFGFHGIEAAAITTSDGDYGQVLLSRWEIDDVNVHDISVDGREPRRLITATVLSPAGKLRVIATHLGLNFSERRTQSLLLCELAAAGELPTLAMGDFNDWFRYRSIQGLLATVFPAASNAATFPSRLPLLALDRIYCRPAGMLVRTGVVPEARLISDHLPLTAELIIPDVRHSCGRKAAAVDSD